MNSDAPAFRSTARGLTPLPVHRGTSARVRRESSVGGRSGDDHRGPSDNACMGRISFRRSEREQRVTAAGARPRLGDEMSAVQNIAVPPHNLEAEKSVLGAVLLDERHLHALLVEEHLRPEHFYREQHGAVFAAMLELYESDRKIDHLTVAETLRQHGKLEEVGGAGGDRRARRLGAGGRPRARVRPDRPRQRADAGAADGLLRDPGERPLAGGAGARAGRAGRALDARGRARRPPEEDPHDRRHPARGDRQAPSAVGARRRR